MLMPKNTKTSRKKTPETERDSTYFLKLVIYIILGTLWLKFASPMQVGDVVLNGLPIGLFIGVVFASHDHFQIDRKVEYAVLIVMTILSYFLPAGIVI
jgi:hypothetical protein